MQQVDPHVQLLEGSEYHSISTPNSSLPILDLSKDIRMTKTIHDLTTADDGKEILGSIAVHGWAQKQGKRIIKGPVHKSWRRRYFALEGSKFYYFHEYIDCKKYFNSRDPDLVVGVLDLKDAFQLGNKNKK